MSQDTTEPKTEHDTITQLIVVREELEKLSVEDIENYIEFFSLAIRGESGTDLDIIVAKDLDEHKLQLEVIKLLCSARRGIDKLKKIGE